MDRREEKRRLRRELFGRLKRIPGAEKSAASREIRQQLLSQPDFREANCVAAFVSLPSEPDLDPLIEATLKDHSWCLPRVDENERVEMRRISGFEDLIVGDFKIREPDPERCPQIPGSEINLILLPGVGFDPANRARLGRGKGHYDRFLERLRELPKAPVVWGVCFADQLISIDPEAHDQPVDAIVTERGILR